MRVRNSRTPSCAHPKRTSQLARSLSPRNCLTGSSPSRCSRNLGAPLTNSATVGISCLADRETEFSYASVGVGVVSDKTPFHTAPNNCTLTPLRKGLATPETATPKTACSSYQFAFSPSAPPPRSNAGFLAADTSSRSCSPSYQPSYSSWTPPPQNATPRSSPCFSPKILSSDSSQGAITTALASPQSYRAGAVQRFNSAPARVASPRSSGFRKVDAFLSPRASGRSPMASPTLRSAVSRGSLGLKNLASPRSSCTVEASSPRTSLASPRSSGVSLNMASPRCPTSQRFSSSPSQVQRFGAGPSPQLSAQRQILSIEQNSFLPDAFALLDGGGSGGSLKLESIRDRNSSAVADLRSHPNNDTRYVRASMPPDSQVIPVMAVKDYEMRNASSASELYEALRKEDVFRGPQQAIVPSMLHGSSPEAMPVASHYEHELKNASSAAELYAALNHDLPTTDLYNRSGWNFGAQVAPTSSPISAMSRDADLITSPTKESLAKLMTAQEFAVKATNSAAEFCTALADALCLNTNSHNPSFSALDGGIRSTTKVMSAQEYAVKNASTAVDLYAALHQEDSAKTNSYVPCGNSSAVAAPRASSHVGMATPSASKCSTKLMSAKEYATKNAGSAVELYAAIRGDNGSRMPDAQRGLPVKVAPEEVASSFAQLPFCTSLQGFSSFAFQQNALKQQPPARILSPRALSPRAQSPGADAVRALSPRSRILSPGRTSSPSLRPMSSPRVASLQSPRWSPRQALSPTRPPVPPLLQKNGIQIPQSPIAVNPFRLATVGTQYFELTPRNVTSRFLDTPRGTLTQLTPRNLHTPRISTVCQTFYGMKPNNRRSMRGAGTRPLGKPCELTRSIKKLQSVQKMLKKDLRKSRRGEAWSRRYTRPRAPINFVFTCDDRAGRKKYSRAHMVIDGRPVALFVPDSEDDGYSSDNSSCPTIIN